MDRDSLERFSVQLDSLTVLQRDILERLSQGMTVLGISRDLEIHRRTVRRVLNQMLDKIHIPVIENHNREFVAGVVYAEYKVRIEEREKWENQRTA